VRNYFKVFRFRHLVDQDEVGGKELPIEHFVFFDDADDVGTMRAFAKAGQAIEELTNKRMHPKVCVFRTLPDFPTVQSILE
jgi:hypothetical protein